MSFTTCSNGHQNPSGSRFCLRCGESLQQLNHSLANPEELPPGTRLRDRYVIQRQLGQGGFGRTYLAEDTGRFNETIVLKELTPANQGTYAIQKAEELFQREAIVLHKLQHPQIPRFWEFFREGKRIFLVQEYIDGETYESLLNQRLQQGQCFSEAEILEFLRQLLPVLSYLHRQGVIHRDIAPDNIIRRSQDELPVLIDLGAVKQIAIEVASQVESSQNSTSSSATLLGKVGYAPDEQLRLGRVAPHSDLYALGVTTVVLLTGKQPQEVIDPYTRDWTWNRQLKSQQLNSVLNGMLAAQPAERFSSADEVLQQLNSISTVPATRLTNRSAHAQATPANNSGQGHVFDSSVKVPEEILGWNWGAFLLPGFWCLTNQVWIGLISWLDLSLITVGLAGPTMGIILGVKGNEWAWKSRSWRSVADFKRHQRVWTIVGCLVWTAIALLVLIVISLILLGIASMGSMGSMMGGD